MPDASTLVIASVLGAFCAARHLRRRKYPVQQIHLRGRSLLSSKAAADILKGARSVDDSGLRLGQQLFPSDIATRHFAFIGTTGSGKTLLQRLLMQSALTSIGVGHGHRAVIYDAKQDILSILCGMRLTSPIHILNPLDSRSVAWNMAADLQSPAAALQAAATLVPESKADSNPFFTNAARHLLYGAILALIELAPGRWTFRHALLLLRDPLRLHRLLSKSEHTHHLLNYFNHPTTAQNIFSTVLTYTSPYEIIAACWDRAEAAISLADWIKSESILVLGNDEQNRAAIDTINRLLFRRLAELALAQEEVDDRAAKAQRTWCFLDEVREAGKLELLGRLLTKGRSKGVAASLGLQDISGMRDAYGRELADELLGQCNTKVILRLNSPETAAWTAKLCGNREVLEARHGESSNRRLSLNADRSSGESVSHAITQQPLLLDSEIMGLPETSRENGLTSLFINPLTGPFEDHIEGAWLSKHLLPAASNVQNFMQRPASDEYLRPWSPEDDALLGFEATSDPQKSTALPAQENPWCH
jgi:type IV secretory pathway TraG/TraD family ATPase VirD4